MQQHFHTSGQILKLCYIIDVPQLVVVHNFCITLVVAKIFTPFQQEFTINSNRISHQQLWNVIIVDVIVLYFWIYVQCILDLVWYFCNLLCSYSTVKFKLNTCVSMHSCVYSFTACKIEKIDMHIHCCMQFCCTRDCQ